MLKQLWSIKYLIKHIRCLQCDMIMFMPLSITKAIISAASRKSNGHSTVLP